MGGEWTSKLGRVFTGVACGAISGWVEKLLAKTSSLRLGWGVE